MAATTSGLQRRLAREESGFTLVELLVVLVIIGILLAVAVPSYLGFKDRASRGAAEANVRSALPAVEAYYADHGNYLFTLNPDNTAAGTTLGALRAIDAGIELSVASSVSSGASYCIGASLAGFDYMKNGPAGDITAGTCT